MCPMMLINMMRLNQYIAKCGIASRRKSDELIRSGRISVNDRIVREMGSKINEDVDQVYFDKRPIKPVRGFSYILLYKPAGVLTTVSDPFQRRTVMNLVPPVPGLVPVGRLDFDTEGVLLLTNDGELTYRLSHPRYQIDKIYFVEVDRQLSEGDIHRLQKGVDIGNKRPAKADSITKLGENQIRMSIHEGRKRQVKRMLNAIGCQVKVLRREQFAFLRCDDLEKSHWRHLKNNEIKALKKIVEIAK
jgi:23S rRNA pseudouridine2605 synthase